MQAIKVEQREWAHILRTHNVGLEKCASLLRDRAATYRGPVCLVCDDQLVATVTLAGCRKAGKRYLIDLDTTTVRCVVEMPVREDSVFAEPDEKGDFSGVPDEDITEYPSYLILDDKGLEIAGLKQK